MANNEFTLEDFAEEKSTPSQAVTQQEAPVDTGEEFGMSDFQDSSEGGDINAQDFHQTTSQQPSDTIFDRLPNNELGARLLNPLIPIAKGFSEGSASFYGKLDAVTKLMEKTIGVKRGGMFEDFQKQSSAFAQSLPDTAGDKSINTVFEFAGSAIPVLSEFALFKAPGLKNMSTVQQFATIQALEEYNKDPEIKSLIEGGAKGAAIGAGLKTGAKTFNVLYRNGKTLAKNWLTLLTRDKKLAEDFVANPKKYNLNPFGKTKSSVEIATENAEAKRRVQFDASQRLNDFKVTQSIKKDQLSSQQKNAKNVLTNTLSDAKNSLKEGSKENLIRLSEKSAQTIERANNSMKENVVGIYDSTLEKYGIIRKDAGQAVGSAIDATLNNNPAASVPYKAVSSKVINIVNKQSPFQIVKGKPVARTAIGAEQGEIETFNRFFDEFKSKASEGKLYIGYLQALKKDLRVLSGKSFKAGNNRLGGMYKDLANEVNPAKIVSENPQLSSSLKEIARANKEFANLVPKYDEAMKLYFTEDATGKFIPNPSKAINAIKGNDPVFLRRMRKADSALPAEDRMLPKLNKLIGDMNELTTKETALIKVVKRKAKQEQARLLDASRKTVQNLNKEQGVIGFEQSQKLRKELFEYTRLQNQQYIDVVESLDKQETFVKAQEALRSYLAPPGLINAVQKGGIMTSVGTSIAGRADVAIPTAISSAVVSPKTNALLLKGLLSGAKGVDKLITPVLASQDLQRLIGKTLSKNKKQ